MKNKKVLIVTFILLAILSAGAVSAAEDADVVAQDIDEVVSQDNAIDDETIDLSSTDVESYLSGGNSTSVDPFVILEINGTSDSPIVDGNDPVFTIIIPGDEKSGSWKPIDELSEAALWVQSENDEVFLNVELSDLDYNAVGYLNHIEHVFYLKDLEGFADLEDGVGVQFYVIRQGVQDASEQRRVLCREDTIYLDEYDEIYAYFISSPGPVNPEEEVGVALVLPTPIDGNINVKNLNTGEMIVEELDISGLDYEWWDEGAAYPIPYDDFDFTKLNHGDLVLFTFEGNNAAPCEYRFLFVDDRDDGLVHFDYFGPQFEIEEVIDTSEDSIVVTIVNPADPTEGEGPYYTGRVSIQANFEEIYTQNITEESATEIPLYLSNFPDFEELEEGTYIVFEFYDEWEAPLAHEVRVFRLDEDGNIILEEDEGPDDEDDFYVDWRDANVVENETVISLSVDEIPDDVDREFTIVVDAWGTDLETVWNLDDLEDVDGFYEWNTADLFINDWMWDIYPKVNLDITIQFYRDGEEAERARGNVNIFNTPYIAIGETAFINGDDYEEPAVTFAYFPDYAEDEFIIRIYKDGRFFADKTFKISEMDQYEDDDEYRLFLNDLGITNLGEYDISIIFTDEDTQDEFSYDGSFTVVPFVIYFWYNWDDVGEPLCRIALPEDSEGNVIVKVNGTKVFEKTLEEIGYSDYRRGPGYYVEVNSLNITESGWYEVEVTVDADVATRTVYAQNYVNTTENTFEFIDFIYGNDAGWQGFNIDMHVGTAISPDSEIVLYLNGIKAATGYFDGDLNLDYVDDSLTDIYGTLKPGEYQGRLEIDGEVVGEGTFAVLDNSGNVNVEVTNDDDTVYVKFKAPMPSDDSLDGYGLVIYVDAVNPNYWEPEDEPFIGFWDDELRDLLNNKVHTIELDGLESGEHIIYVVYRTDLDYSLDEQDFFVRIYNITMGDGEPVQTTITAYKVVADYNSDKKITATLKDANGNPVKGASVEIEVGSLDEILTTNSNGKVSLSTNGLNPGTYSAVISFAGNAAYAPSTKTTQVTINKINTTLDAMDVSVQYGEGEFIATLTNDATSNAISSASVIANINGVDYTVKTNSKGQAVFSTASLAPGVYTATVSYAGNSKYNPSSATAKVTVKADTSIAASDVTVICGDEAGQLIATLTNAATGKAISSANVILNVNGANYTVKTNSKGQAAFSTASLPQGTYTATVSYAGNSKYNPSSATAKVTVKAEVIIDAKDTAARFNDGTELVATLTNAATGKAISGASVVFNINNKKTTVKTNSKGQALLSLGDLALGTYDVAISYAGNSKYLPASTSVEVSIVDKAEMIIVCSDIAINYNDGSELVATLINSLTDKAVSGATIAVNLNGVDSTVKSDSKGQVFVSTKGLVPGSYAATLSYAGNSKYAPASVTVNILVNKATINIFVNDTGDEFVATLTNAATGKAISNAKVSIQIGDVKYSVKTDSKGRAKVSTAGLDPKVYTASASYAGNSKYASSKATIKLDAVKATTIISAAYDKQANEIVATLINAETGKAISGASVGIKLNGVKTTYKTDSNGQVRISANVDTPGKYSVLSSYVGNTKYTASSISQSFFLGY